MRLRVGDGKGMSCCLSKGGSEGEREETESSPLLQDA